MFWVVSRGAAGPRRASGKGKSTRTRTPKIELQLNVNFIFWVRVREFLLAPSKAMRIKFRSLHA